MGKASKAIGATVGGALGASIAKVATRIVTGVLNNFGIDTMGIEESIEYILFIVCSGALGGTVAYMAPKNKEAI